MARNGSTWQLAGSSRVLALHSASRLLSSVEQLRPRVSVCSQFDFFRRSLNVKPLKHSSYLGPDSSLVVSCDHSGSTIDSRADNSRVPHDSLGLRRGQRLWRGLSSRRGVQLSPNHFRSAPQRKPARTVCCLTVEARPLTSHSPRRGAKEANAAEGKRERRRIERLLLAKTKEVLRTEGSPELNFRLML